MILYILVNLFYIFAFSHEAFLLNLLWLSLLIFLKITTYILVPYLLLIDNSIYSFKKIRVKGIFFKQADPFFIKRNKRNGYFNKKIKEINQIGLMQYLEDKSLNVQIAWKINFPSSKR